MVSKWLYGKAIAESIRRDLLYEQKLSIIWSGR